LNPSKEIVLEEKAKLEEKIKWFLVQSLLRSDEQNV